MRMEIYLERVIILFYGKEGRKEGMGLKGNRRG